VPSIAAFCVQEQKLLLAPPLHFMLSLQAFALRMSPQLSPLLQLQTPLLHANVDFSAADVPADMHTRIRSAGKSSRNFICRPRADTKCRLRTVGFIGRAA
jgi:hypothetical protein